MAPRFEPLTDRDIDELCGLIQEVMTEFGLDDAKDLKAELRSAANDTNRENLFLTLRDSDELVGCGALRVLLDDDKLGRVVELRRMYLRRSARGHGLGQALLEELLSRARRMGYDHCYLETAPQLVAATELYRRRGFEPLDAPLGKAGHCGCPDYFLLKL